VHCRCVPGLGWFSLSVRAAAGLDLDLAASGPVGAGGDGLFADGKPKRRKRLVYSGLPGTGESVSKIGSCLL